MRDPRLEKLAKTLLEYSNKVEAGQHVLIKGNILAKPLIKELIKHTYRIGAYPHTEILDDEIGRELSLGNTEERMEKVTGWNLEKYKDIDAFISVFADENDSEYSDVPTEIKVMQARVGRPVSNLIVNTKQWVLLNYPTPSLAQKAKMSLEQFEDFLLDVCLVDYSKMNEAMKNLKALMERTDKVHITGPGTDLTFSIKGLQAIPCAGDCNIPDGEVFTAPVRESVNGIIQYNTPSPYQGTVFNNVKLAKIKDLINVICLNYSKVASSEAIQHREADEYSIYTKQYIHDINNLKEIILKAQELVNDCNESLFLISSASVQNHVYNFGEIEENKNGEN